MLQHYNVLIVDDCEADRHIYKHYLSDAAMDDQPYRITEARLAEEALNYCRRRLPDCILLDFTLPDKNGLVFMQELQEISNAFSTSLTPVIVISGHANMNMALRLLEEGAEHCFSKEQITEELVRESVRGVIAKKHPLEAEQKRSFFYQEKDLYQTEE